MDQAPIEKAAAYVLRIDRRQISDLLKRESIKEWDSFNHLALMSEIEKKLGITFTTEEIEKIWTIGDIKRLAKKKGYHGP